MVVVAVSEDGSVVDIKPGNADTIFRVVKEGVHWAVWGDGMHERVYPTSAEALGYAMQRALREDDPDGCRNLGGPYVVS